MSLEPARARLPLGDIDPVVAAAVPIAVAPFGYLLGGLVVSHLLRSETEAVWVTTTVLVSLAMLVVAARS